MIEIDLNLKKVTFKKELTFNELKEELKVLKKSYKDIFDWKVEIEAPHVYDFNLLNSGTSNSSLINSDTYYGTIK